MQHLNCYNNAFKKETKYLGLAFPATVKILSLITMKKFAIRKHLGPEKDQSHIQINT